MSDEFTARIDKAIREQCPEYYYGDHTIPKNTSVKRCLSFEGMNMSWNLNLFSGPKFNIACWDCRTWFTKRIPRTDFPIIACTYCNAKNEIPIVLR